MRGWLTSFLLVPALACAEWKGDVGLGLGSRIDQHAWSISGIEGVPDVLSELEWDELESVQLELSGRGISSRGYTVRGDFALGWAYHGDNRDRDYFYSGKTGLFSDSIADASGSHHLDASLGFGYGCIAMEEALRFYALFGVSTHFQHLKMTDGQELFPEQRPIPGLDSWYRACWTGPWIGIDIDYDVTDFFTLVSSLQLHWARYRGRGHWNLRQDFYDDFRHSAGAHGVVVRLGAELPLPKEWLLRAMVTFQDWESEQGTAKTYWEDEEGNREVIRQPFREATWCSLAALLTLLHRF